MNYTFHPLAVRELNSAAEYYDTISSGLASSFSKEIFSTIQRIILFPSAWTKISENCRRCLLHRFPYAIIYYIRENEIIIIAITQLNKKPKNWEKHTKRI